MIIQNILCLLIGFTIGFSVHSLIFKASIKLGLKLLSVEDRNEFLRLLDKLKERNR